MSETWHTPGVAHDVGERLLHDAVRRDVDHRRHVAQVAVDVERRRRSRRRASGRDELAEAREARRRRERRSVSPAPRSTPSIARSSSSASLLVRRIASSARRAAAGSVSMTCAAAPDCTAMIESECAVTSCSSRAMRSRSSSTRRRASSSRVALGLGGALLDLGDVGAAVARRVAERGGDAEHRDDAHELGPEAGRGPTVRHDRRACTAAESTRRRSHDATVAQRADRVERDERGEEDERRRQVPSS